MSWRIRVSSKVDFPVPVLDRKSTRLNSSHANISYAVFCLKKELDVTVRLALALPADCGGKTTVKVALCAAVSGSGVMIPLSLYFFFNDPAPANISPLPLHEALPI